MSGLINLCQLVLCNSCQVYNLCLAGYKVECMGLCGCSINWPVGGVASRDVEEAGTANISQKKKFASYKKDRGNVVAERWCLFMCMDVDAESHQAV